MPRLIPPIADFDAQSINSTLHGRSVYRSEDVPGHNVFCGWDRWRTNGHRGVGDALDIAGQGWRTPIVAVCDGVQTIFHNDTTKLEVVYLEGNGIVAVYAHINAAFEGTGKHWRQGETIGVLRGDLSAPHIHFELWIDGKVVADQTPERLRVKMLALFAEERSGELMVIYPPDAGAAGIVKCHPEIVDGITRVDLTAVCDRLGFEAVYRDDQNKVYILHKEAQL